MGGGWRVGLRFAVRAARAAVEGAGRRAEERKKRTRTDAEKARRGCRPAVDQTKREREGEGGRETGWVIYFQPSSLAGERGRHNLSRGFSRKHAAAAEPAVERPERTSGRTMAERPEGDECGGRKSVGEAGWRMRERVRTSTRVAEVVDVVCAPCLRSGAAEPDGIYMSGGGWGVAGGQGGRRSGTRRWPSRARDAVTRAKEGERVENLAG